jgi:Predicted signal transduction protein with a C-terminal ATPase domain
MKKKRKQYSLQRSLILLIIIVFFPVIIIMLFMSNYTKNKLCDEVAISYKTNIGIQIHNIDNWIKKDDNFLLNLFHTDMNVQYLKENQNKSNRSNYIYNLKKIFENHQVEGSACEAYFILFKEKKYSTITLNGKYTSKEKLAVQRFLNNQNIPEKLTSINWEAVNINGQFFFIRELCKNGFCIGSLVKVETILSMIGLRENESNIMSMIDRSGNILSKADWIKENEINILASLNNNGIYLKTGRKDEYMLIKIDFSVLKGTFSYIMYNKDILGNLSIVTHLLNVIFLFTIAMLLIALLVTNNVVIVPLKRLKAVIEQIKNGNMNTKIECDNASLEFMNIYSLFNEMMEKINYFKIRSYEVEIQKKTFQLQYYSIQLKPHFYLNSLKCLYALAQKKDYAKIQEMILGLSEYFKYLTYDSQSLIPLEEELKYTSKYISIRQLGVVNELECILSIDNRARKFPVLGLSVQTFVENSIKYAVYEDRKLIIEVKVNIMEQDDTIYMDIIVSDNGEGYNPNIIETVNMDETDKMNGHIGLINLKNRLKLLYGDEAYMAISNLPTGGAYSEIMFPVKEVTK